MGSGDDGKTTDGALAAAASNDQTHLMRSKNEAYDHSQGAYRLERKT